MKLFTFGDSWTEGVGGNRKYEDSTDNPEQKTTIRKNYGWPKHLSELLKCEVNNYGVGAFSNNAIFNAISYKLKNEIITQDDFVVIMWSSSLRDPLPFFSTEDDFFIWGKRYKSKQHLLKYIFDGVISDNVNYNRAEKNFRDYYIGNLFSDTYYDIVNQNYILHLQFLFNEMGIKYLFCDAFDSMINKNIDALVDKTDLIESGRYWGYRNKTMANLLIDTNRKDVWEDGNNWTNTTAGKHPNNNGYKLIAEELYKFISENNLLISSKPKKSHLL
jgi:lysophospholipase L1-like esterase